MTKQEKQDLVIVGAVVVAFTALGFLAGYIFGNGKQEKEKQLVVTPAGELVQQEIEQ